jgi:hypothetical protein
MPLIEIYWDHTAVRKGPYGVPQMLQNKRTGVFRKIAHGDVEGKDDGGAMVDESASLRWDLGRSDGGCK